VIKTFRHAGLERFYRTGSKAGIQPKHDKKLRTQLTALPRHNRRTWLCSLAGTFMS
jgi:proteic killer suppression protein